jgi:hypothetical protein
VMRKDCMLNFGVPVSEETSPVDVQSSLKADRKHHDLGGVKKEMLSAHCIEGEEAMFLTFEGIVQTNKFG